MKKAAWSRTAERQLESYLDYLAGQDADRPERARSDIQATADETAGRPGLARPARWPGMFERSVRLWRKLLVFRLEDRVMRVVAFYDMRQDLSAVDPLSE